ncbi:MAG: DMT family transporter, partial [Clostridiales bacterium]|nr:DMT family transporter [Clostridiales bacterium]
IMFINKLSAQKKGVYKKETPEERRVLIKGGVLCGICLFAGCNLQQYAFVFSPVGKVGFITALYMILVPIIGIFFKKRPRPLIWICVLIAAVGLYLLCIDGSLELKKGDIVTLLGAVCFAFHIITIDHFSSKTDGVKLSFLQFLVSGMLSFVCMWIFETPELKPILSAAVPIIYAGIMSCGVAFTFQIIGQKYTEPTISSMLLCLESVFAVIFAWLIIHQTLTAREISGCAIMFTAIILSQLPQKRKKEEEIING